MLSVYTLPGAIEGPHAALPAASAPQVRGSGISASDSPFGPLQPPLSYASATLAPLRYDCTDVFSRSLPRLMWERCRPPVFVLAHRWCKAASWTGLGGTRAHSFEGAWQRYAPRALIPFDNVCGWAGVAVTLPHTQPVVVLSAHGALPTVLPLLLPLRQSTTGLTGGGTGTSVSVPGDALFHAAASAVVFAPFHSTACWDGFVCIDPAALLPGGKKLPPTMRLCQMPRPAWPTLPFASRDLPTVAAPTQRARDRLFQYPLRRVPAGAIYDLVSGDGLPPPRGEAVIAVAALSLASQQQQQHTSMHSSLRIWSQSQQGALADAKKLVCLTSVGTSVTWPLLGPANQSAAVVDIVTGPSGCAAVLQQQLVHSTIHKLAFLEASSQVCHFLSFSAVRRAQAHLFPLVACVSCRLLAKRHCYTGDKSAILVPFLLGLQRRSQATRLYASMLLQFRTPHREIMPQIWLQ
jgi:hypothetical protein